MNSNTQNKSQFWGQLLSNIEILSFLFPQIINVCIKLILTHSVKGGYVFFFFQYVDDNNLVDFGFFCFSFLVLWHFDKDYTDFGFSFLSSRIRIQKSGFLFIFCLDLLAWIFPYVLLSLFFFSLENPLSNDNSNNKNDKGCVDISRA